MDRPTVFINIGWMMRYQGETPDDQLYASNFGYFKQDTSGERPLGHECWNFLDQEGEVVGYVPRSSGINITRLGAAPSQQELNGVLVVFISRDPVRRISTVVGWYENATVARSPVYQRVCEGMVVDSPIRASAKDAYVLPVAKREITIPSAHKEEGGLGQSPVWYADKLPHKVEEVWALVDARRAAGKPRITPPGRNSDPDARRAVELFAMDWALKYFDGAKDVSLACKGWDVEALADGEDIYIEVKGISGASVNFELTPNEYAKMKEHRSRYYLFVVTQACTKQARASIFRFKEEGGGFWVSEEGGKLKLTERVGAWAVC